MLVQCEMYEVDGQVVADIACEKCGEIAAMQVPRETVTALVMGTVPVICPECQESKCKSCGKFPATQKLRETWIKGICWECHDKAWRKQTDRLGALAYLLSLAE